MTLSALGIFSAAGAGGVAFSSDYELIETQILGSTQAAITFSSLGTYSSTYKHLQVRAVLRSTRANTGDIGAIRINGDTTASNYAYHLLAGRGGFGGATNVVSASETTNFYGLSYINAGSEPANAFSGAITDILDAYSTTKNKTIRSFHSGAYDWQPVLQSQLWKSTSSITSITYAPVIGSTFAAGTRISLYGIKG
jgi:hypothetical protein